MEYVIFGAGILGKELLKKLGKENVKCFIDNDRNKQGMFLDEIPVYSYEYYKCQLSLYPIIICASWVNIFKIVEQLKQDYIDYKIYIPKLLEESPLISYGSSNQKSENEIKEEFKKNENKIYVREYVDKIDIDNVPLFDSIEIETINRCNGLCSFCPVNVKNDIRELKKMDLNLFYKIIKELEEMSYPGRVSLFSNNEPFLDNRIVELSQYAREHIKYAHIHMFTNGSLLNLDKYKNIIQYLDELIIDNYSDNLELHDNIREIYEYIKNNDDEKLKYKTKILIRKQNEILTSRGGDAPNRTSYINVDNETCTLPFRQMIVRPDGKVSLCCNDPYGRETMGDLNEMTLKDVWYGNKYRELRKKIKIGRKNLQHCKNCDTFM